jgi:O-antigen/teichoic acid export membrane protein
MTVKVVKGSVWTLIGQVIPMAVALFAAPFTIRFLGSEGYGVLVLLSVIPSYFGFADLGMGIASTKFASEAYAKGDRREEAEVVRAAGLIAFVFCLFFAVPLFLFSSPIVREFNVPEHFLDVASVGLKIASASFVLSVLALVFNTPMLSRLRMDLNSLVNTVPKVIISGGVPIVLYFGGGIVGAILTSLCASVIGLLGVVWFSGRLLPEMFGLSIRREHFRPLLKFGVGLLIGGIAAVMLVNFEKLALPKMVSVRSLAYYSVAFTLASMANTFSAAMMQSLVPAFSQLLAPQKKEQFDTLFARSMRFNLIVLLPTLMVLAVISRPFFTIWAGREFGDASTLPFYILLFGLFFNIVAYIPHSTITARGRTDIFAKLYWFEFAFYVGAVLALINWFGIAGAAAAWSLRVILDAFIIIWFSKRVSYVSFHFLHHSQNLLLGIAILLPPVVFAIAVDNFSLWLAALVPASLLLYALVIWKRFVEPEERTWILARASGLMA